ncbi:hypothetical protein, partial [Endozoicomonas sp. ONNA2]|uniref:hypothetical protein n=1 Tax=Endozoicomonas sp. ONNA2 TaxID=2828741 RepID=UPI0021480F22
MTAWRLTAFVPDTTNERLEGNMDPSRSTDSYFQFAYEQKFPISDEVLPAEEWSKNNFPILNSVFLMIA